MSEITYKEIEANEIASVKGLCDSLMEFQAEMGEIRTDILAAMNFENRFVPDYHGALRKNVTVALDDGVPVGFSFAAINDVTDEDVHSLPVWAGEMGGNGFYPEDYAVPKRVGTFKLLFVDPAYRGLDIGKHLSDKSMHWLRSHDDVDDLWVYVANGNERVGAFYEAYGFKFSHSVFNGFIRAYSQGAKD